ncbi:MAG: AEC family transporter [Oxalobacter formigenes]|nr:AEC family transporter [Oxalobacter formigenes]
MMLEVVPVVLPVFLLIALGYFFRRSGVMQAAAVTELNRFVVFLALPALTADILVNSTWEELWQPGFIVVFEIAAAVLFIPVFLVRFFRTKDVAAAAVDATAASYANTGYIGIPLCLLAFGEASLPPVVIAGVLTVSVNFAFSLVLMEVGKNRSGEAARPAGQVVFSLFRNPLILSPLAGMAMLVLGFRFPDGIRQGVRLLGSAACPCALVATGLFLAQKQEATSTAVSAWLVLLKLVCQPLIAWVLVRQVFLLPDIWAKTAVILSAMPTGTGPFMLAEFYGKGAGVASRTIFFSTVGSVVTLVVWLNLL